MASREEIQITKKTPEEWEETITAEGEEPLEALEEPTPLEELPPIEEEKPETPELLEPTPLEDTPPEPSEPEPSEPLPLDLPTDLQKYVKYDGERVVAKEPYLDRKTRAALEKRLRGKGVHLHERRWLPRKQESPRAVAHAIDALEWAPRYDPKAVAWLQKDFTERHTVLKGLERIPANIVAQRVVFETDGGYVVEVVHWEMGQLHKKHLSVPAKASRAQTLAALRAGRFTGATLISPDLVDAVIRGPARSTSGVPAGQVHTWPIRNRHKLEQLGALSATQVKTLHKLGIKTTDQLRVRPPGLLARHVRVTSAEAQEWRWASEFLLVAGVKPAHAAALAKVGVRGVGDLRNWDGDQLAETLASQAAKAKGRKRVPPVTVARAKAWIRGASRLKQTNQRFPA